MNPVGFAQAINASLTRDATKFSARQRRRSDAHFQKVRRAELTYSLQLRKVAKHVGDLIKMFNPLNSASEEAELQSILSRYADILQPWARAAAQRMIAEVSRRDEQAWFKTAEKIGVSLRKEVQQTDVGYLSRQILDEQVHLITSLPLEAGRRVQKLALEFYTGGRRYNELVPLIMDSGNVTVSRANLIARTEVAKAASAITQARALHIGSEGYIWRTALDPFVRKTHKQLEGSFHKWDDSPIAEEGGQRHHPGEFPNCRCYPEPIIPDVIQ